MVIKVKYNGEWVKIPYLSTGADSSINSVYRVKGTVANYNALPTTNVVVGDVYNLEDTGANYVATSTTPTWDKLSETVDLSAYSTTVQNDAKYQPKGNYLTSIPSEYVTDTELNSKGYLTDATSDGKLYGRKDGVWSEVQNESDVIAIDFQKLYNQQSLDQETLTALGNALHNGNKSVYLVEQDSAMISASLGKSGSSYAIETSVGRQVTRWDIDSNTGKITLDSSNTYELAKIGEVLGKYDTIEYTPTNDYNPATKKYVDDAVNNAINDSLNADCFSIAYSVYGLETTDSAEEIANAFTNYDYLKSICDAINSNKKIYITGDGGNFSVPVNYINYSSGSEGNNKYIKLTLQFNYNDSSNECSSIKYIQCVIYENQTSTGTNYRESDTWIKQYYLGGYELPKTILNLTSSSSSSAISTIVGGVNGFKKLIKVASDGNMFTIKTVNENDTYLCTNMISVFEKMVNDEGVLMLKTTLYNSSSHTFADVAIVLQYSAGNFTCQLKSSAAYAET